MSAEQPTISREACQSLVQQTKAIAIFFVGQIKVEDHDQNKGRFDFNSSLFDDFCSVAQLHYKGSKTLGRSTQKLLSLSERLNNASGFVNLGEASAIHLVADQLIKDGIAKPECAPTNP